MRVVSPMIGTGPVSSQIGDVWMFRSSCLAVAPLEPACGLAIASIRLFMEYS